MEKNRMMKKKTYKKDLLFISIVFCIAVCARFIFANFTKTIHLYPDELRYYGLARSLWYGDGISLRNMSSNYQKIGYSLLLSPFFLIQNGFLRIKAISLFNCIIMSFSILPVWLIGKELKLERKYNYFLVVVTALWPDMTLTMGFMSEILFWPLVFTFVYLWLYNKRVQKWWISIVLGFVCYAGYICKEIFLAFLLSAIAFEILDLILSLYFEKKTERKISFINLGIFIALFLIMHVAMKTTVFKGFGNSYNQMGLSAIKSVYNIFFMIYGFLVYIAASMLAAFFFPVMYPMLYYKKLSKAGQNLFLFTVLSILAISTTVAYTITVREDLGLIMPAVHLRYVAPVIILTFCVLLQLCQKDITDDNKFPFTCLAILPPLLFMTSTFKGLGSTPVVSWCSLAWYKIPQKLFGTINKGCEFVLRPHIIVVAVCFIIAVYLLHFIKEKKGNAIFFNCFIFLCLLISLVSNVISIKLSKEGYTADNKIIQEIEKIDAFFTQKSNSPHILYISAGELANENAYFDTYFDSLHNAYIVRDSDVLALAEHTILSDTKLTEPESGKFYNISNVEYIIIPSTLSIECKNSTLLKDLSGPHYSVYKNNTISQISVAQKKKRSYSFAWNVCVSNGYDKDCSRYLSPNGTSYGPYWNVQKGSYSIEIQGENLTNTDIKLYSAKGAVNYPYTLEKCDENMIILNFSLDSNITNFEINITNKDSKTIKMDSLYLIPAESLTQSLIIDRSPSLCYNF